jgi:hypothetical protein
MAPLLLRYPQVDVGPTRFEHDYQTEDVGDNVVVHAPWPDPEPTHIGVMMTRWGVVPAPGVREVTYVFPALAARMAPLRPVRVMALERAIALALSLPHPPVVSVVGLERMFEGVRAGTEVPGADAREMLPYLTRETLAALGADPELSQQIRFRTFAEWRAEAALPHILTGLKLSALPLNEDPRPSVQAQHVS